VDIFSWKFLKNRYFGNKIYTCFHFALISEREEQKMNIKDMKLAIRNVLHKYNFIYLKIDDSKSIEIVYDLFINHNENYNIEDMKPVVLIYFGAYYDTIKINTKLMKKFYAKAIWRGEITALLNLSSHYGSLKKFDKKEKYLLMAIDEKHDDSLNELGYLYYVDKVDYALALKYYTMSVEKGNVGAMNGLGHYYQFVEKNYDKAKMYYIMATEKGLDIAMNNFAFYYEHVENNYALMKKYYEMAIEKGNTHAMYNYGHYFQHATKNFNDMKKYYSMALQNRDQRCLSDFIKYYLDNPYDFSFLLLFPCVCLNSNNTDISILINNYFESSIDLPKMYHESFCNISLGKKIEPLVKYKQYVLKRTGIFPRKFKADSMILFMDILSIAGKRSCCLPSDIMMHIAGNLFV
jgi:hypothetical protein